MTDEDRDWMRLYIIRCDANSREALQEIREVKKKIDERAEADEKRFSALEERQTKTETHLRWMKGIWASAQAFVIAWFGSK